MPYKVTFTQNGRRMKHDVRTLKDLRAYLKKKKFTKKGETQFGVWVLFPVLSSKNYEFVASDPDSVSVPDDMAQVATS